ncbi:MAG TPA: ATP-binding cassette domain-containing protein [Gemmatimonadaceae bacterium]|nr:ATP-binding cassette domain-containing protein [Gemmatimonadaceae bacterium]
MVELRDIAYVAGGKTILRDVTVSLRERQFNVLLGPNGAGKSTLLNIATGLARPTTGSVHYGETDIHTLDMETLARKRAVLSQHIELAFPMPVEDVVLMGRYPHYGRVPSPRDREIVRRALDLVGMTERRAQAYPTLSGGERQKVQLARVLAQIWNEDDARTPTFLFLDEPTSSLDIHYQIALLDVARALLERNCTVVAILHDVNVALHYGDYFVLLAGGRVAAATEADGITRSLLERVFEVRAHRIEDPETGERLWRFAL